MYIIHKHPYIYIYTPIYTNLTHPMDIQGYGVYLKTGYPKKKGSLSMFVILHTIAGWVRPICINSVGL